MARFLGSLYLAGATIALVSLAVAQAPGTNMAGLYAVIASAYVLGAVVLAWRNRLTPGMLSFALALATVVISMSMFFADDRTGVYAMFYVWVGLTAAYFLTWPQVVLQASFLSAAYAAVLSQSPSAQPAEQWLVVVGTVVVAAGIVGVLRRGVARLIANLADSARSDALTGFLNLRGFHELMDVELERSRRSNRPLSLLIVDLDDFKQVNDRFGHPGGDRALKLFARSLRETIRRIDVAARVAGDRFAVVLPETESHSAYLLAERLRRKVNEEIPATPVKLGLSIGVATAPRHGLVTEELLHAGERALYAAKQLGRDRSVLYDPEIIGELMAADSKRELQREENIAAVLVLAETLDMRDSGTARHSQTVARLAAGIATELGMLPRAVERIKLAGVLHDIGKIGVADSILRKPGPLTGDEYEEMKKHSELGARILAGANLEDISAWVWAHHERPDGLGYPQGLMDSEIPLEAKILAVADSYEAMTSDRVYRMAMPADEAAAELRACAGTQFDPAVVDALLVTLHAERTAA